MKKITIIFVALGLFLLTALIIGGNEVIKGAAIADISQPVFNLKMDDDLSLSGGKVLESKGAYTTSISGGKQNRALQFDGRNDNVITSSSHLQNLDQFTIMLWMQPASLSLLKRAHLVWQGDLDEKSYGQNAGNGWGPEQELHVSLGDESGLNKYEDYKLTFYFGDENNKLKISTLLKYSDWQQVAVVVKNSEQGASAELYLDGVLVSDDAIDKKIDRQKWAGSTLYLGSAGKNGPAGDSDRYYEGKLDELAIYDKTLSAEEIFKLCRRQNNGEICGS